jgi:hypothetical protein
MTHLKLSGRGCSSMWRSSISRPRILEEANPRQFQVTTRRLLPSLKKVRVSNAGAVLARTPSWVSSFFNSTIRTDGSYIQSEMAQCSEAHLFCATCVKSYASTQLGSQSADLVCMDTSGCRAPFAEPELRRVLDSKLMDLYERLTARANIDKAGIEGLEECPFCEYRCVIDNEMEKLFRCKRSECGVVSCRACKKPVGVNLSAEELGLIAAHLRTICQSPVKVGSTRIRRLNNTHTCV